MAQSDATVARARALFEAGRAAINDGDYEAAYRYFREADETYHRPELLYNLANAAERLRHDDDALRLYRQYLEELPDAPNRSYVEGRIRALAPPEPETPAVEEPAPSAEGGDSTSDGTDSTSDGTGSTSESAGPATDLGDSSSEDEGAAETDPGDPGAFVDAPATPQQSGGSGLAGWLVLGGGAVVAVVGGALLGVGIAAKGKVDHAAPDSSWANVQGSYHRAHTLTPAGGVLLAVGVAAAAVGVVVALTSGGDGSSDVALRVGPGHLSVEGSF